MKKLFTTVILVVFSIVVFAQVEKKVIVEHFTNSVCPICASKNPALYSLLEDYPQVIHIAFHPSAPYSSCIFSQFNPIENDARTNYYGIYGSTPWVVVQGDVIPPATPMLTAAQLDMKLNMLSDYDIVIKHYYTDSDTVEVITTIKRVSGEPQSGLTYRGFLTEKMVDYTSPNGETQHPDVFRKMVTEQPVDLQNISDSMVIVSKYLPDNVWDQEMMYVVGVLQRESDKAILQSAQSGFAQNMTAVKEQFAKEPQNVFYPNPVINKLNIKKEYAGQYSKAEIFDIFGKKVEESPVGNPIALNNLQSGYYFLVLKGDNNSTYTTKFIKR